MHTRGRKANDGLAHVWNRRADRLRMFTCASSRTESLKVTTPTQSADSVQEAVKFGTVAQRGFVEIAVG